ncbi:MAG: lytic transglycosylase domain-containing protein [Desulfovibrio sp.]|nr:lytic transglycosylase domain-containing protein [Desulfovibrio sp.]
MPDRSAERREGLVRLRGYEKGSGGSPPMRIRALPRKGSPAESKARAKPSSYAGVIRAAVGPDWERIIYMAGGRHGVDVALLTAVLQIESNFKRDAVSGKGALGAMQIMPETGRELGLTDFFDPMASTDAGARYLAAQLRDFPRLELSLAAYNAGPAAVRKYGGIPPYQETRDFVVRVLEAYRKLSAQRAK